MNLPRPWLILLAVGACSQDVDYEGAFEQPVALAVLDPAQGGPFDEPIAYIANGDGGRIVPVALKAGRFLTDDAHGAFLRSAPLGTGGHRRLMSVAAWAPDAQTVTVYAGDARDGVLVKVPHVIGVDADGVPVEPEAALVGEPAFADVDGSGDRATLADFVVHTGYSATETWTLTYDGDVWEIVGSVSGPVGADATFDEPYRYPLAPFSFEATGTATAGDTFTVQITGTATALDVGGVPSALAVRPDQSVIAMVVEDAASGDASLAWFDPTTDAVVAGPALPPGAEPVRMSWSADGSTLWVADSALSTVWEVRPDTDEVVPHATPWPVADVAVLDDGVTRRLYVAPRAATELWTLAVGDTPDQDAWIDVNTWADGGQGLSFAAPVTGIEAIPVSFRHPGTDAAGVHPWGRAVAVSLASGAVVFVDEASGCLISDEEGPRSAVSSSFTSADYETTVPSDVSGPTLAVNVDGTRHVSVNPCAGLAVAEAWTVTFDVALQAWVVEGTRSGKQVALAYEDRRYVNDAGTISFLIRSGSTPSQDGWRFGFKVESGAHAANGSGENGDASIAMDVPTDPVFFHYLTGPVSGGWDVIEDRPFVLVAASATDRVERVDPSDGTLEVDWR